MKKITLFVFAAFASCSLFSQSTIVFHEDFETADSVVATGTPLWAPDLTLQSQGLASYKNTVGASTQSYLTTTAFSTLGNNYVQLDFDQICKIEQQDSAIIEVSNDNGVTWNRLTATQYQGTATFLSMGNRFAAQSYLTFWLPGQNFAIPTNGWWKSETFDVSVFLANSAQCMIRFKLDDGNLNGPNSNYGWLLDKLKVTAGPSEVTPPVITQLPIFYSGPVFTLGPFTINDSITDASGIASATLFYTLNYGPQQTVPMTNVSGNHWAGTIPACADSDTICYYVQAIDASIAANTALLPVSGCTQFIAHPPLTFPYSDDFDGTTLFYANNISLTSQWQLGVPAFGQTTGAHSGADAWDINLTTAYDNNANCNLLSPVFDFSNTQYARLSFWHNYNCEAFWDGTRIDYTTDGGNTWNVLGVMNDPRGTNWYNYATINSSNLPAWAGSSGGWVKSEYRLDTLNNEPNPVQFRFVFTSDASVTYDGYSIDDVNIYIPDSVDVGVATINSPSGITVNNAVTSVSITIKNDGITPVTSIPVVYKVGLNAPVVETWNGNLLPNATTTYTFTTTYIAPAGAYQLCAWTQLAADTDFVNDTICKPIFGMPIYTVPWSDNFDGPQNFAAVNTYTPSWELGNPQAPLITGTHSGPNAWEINLNGPYANNSNEMLYSPFFDFSNVTNVELRFWQWYNCDNFSDGGRVEYSTDMGVTWTVLGVAFDPNATAWYNQSFINSSGLPGWTGNGGGYFQSKYNLTMFNNYPNPVQFRYVFTSDNFNFATVDGWAIDDWELFVPVDAATNTITFSNPSPLPMPGNNNVKINIKNTGNITLTNVNATLKIDNNIVVTDALTPNLAPGASMNHQFSMQWTGATPGLHTVKCWTSAPNGLVDTNPSNDTTTWIISVMDTFATYPYCNDFETSNGIPALTTMNALRFTNSNSDFIQGTPAKNIMVGAHGGTGCWITGLTQNYLRNDSAGFFLPVFTVDTIHCYHLEFWSRELTQVNQDGGVVEYSFDMGSTWQHLGMPLEPNWYNSAVCTGLGPAYQPNFSGTSNGWVKMQHDIRFSQAGQVIFRFRFGSDNGIESEGWAIDDICFQQNAPCVLAVAEEPSMNGLNMVAYPNPAGTSTVLAYNLPSNGKVQIKLGDLLGQEINSFEGNGIEGENAWTVDVSGLANGVYFYELTFGTQKIVEKLVISH